MTSGQLLKKSTKETGSTDNLLHSIHDVETTLSNNLAPDNKQPSKQIEQKQLDKEQPSIDVQNQAIKSEKQEKSVKEQAFEQYKKVDEKKPEESPYVIKQAKTAKDDIMTDDAGKSATLIEIEEIMSDGLANLYQNMTPEQQSTFKKKGEEVARAIEDLTHRVKVTARKVLSLIREWLKLIPGVNRYFLEQEAKIKTEELLKLAHKKRLQKNP